MIINKTSRFRPTAFSVFCRDSTASSHNTLTLSYTDGSFCGYNLLIDLTQPEIEMPTVALTQYEHIVQKVFRGEQYHYAISPLYITNIPIRIKSFDTALRKMFIGIQHDVMLQPIVIDNTTFWYGGAGILLDKDMCPLLLCTVSAEKGDDNILINHRAICHIHPRLMVEWKDNFLYKGILTKLLPVYATYCAFLNMPRTTPQTVKIIIDEDIEKFIIHPTMPSVSTANEECNQCLIDNCDDIIQIY